MPRSGPPARRPILRIFGLPAGQPPGEGPVGQGDRDEPARALAALGFRAVTVGVAGAGEAAGEAARAAGAAGLDVWGCRAAFRLPEPVATDSGGPEDLRAQDVDGVPRVWFGSGCPNRPELRRRHLDSVAALAASGAFAGFMLDGIRFASPHAGPAYWTCFCPGCAARAGALGIDFQRLRRAVGALRDAPGPPVADPAALVAHLEAVPGLADWLRFRAATVLEHVREVRAAVDAANAAAAASGGAGAAARGPFRLGAYLFAPSLAPLVGQDYAALAPLLDVVSPMLYRTLEGDACLASEWGALAELGLLARRDPFTPDEVAAEVALARAALPPGEDGPGGRAPAALVPILQLADEAVEATARGALDAGADGVDYFAFRAGMEGAVARAAAVRFLDD